MMHVKVAVASGENRFSMSHGSFQYRQKLGPRRPLTLTTRVRTAWGFRLIYTDKSNGQKYEFQLREESGRLSLTCAGENRPWANRWWLTFDVGADEHFYGCGETYSKLDLRGEKVRIWVAEHQNTGRISRKLIREKLFGKQPDKVLPFGRYESYYAQPTFVSSAKYYVHCPVNTYSEFDFTRPGRFTLYFQEPPAVVSERGGSFEEVSEKLSDLLGRPAPLPDWIYDGGIYALQDWVFDGKTTREGFDGCGNVERKLDAARQAGVRVSGVWCQDWCGCRCTQFGYQVMWNWRYDPRQYPDLPGKIREWDARGVKFLGYINPFLALEGDLYQTASERGYCVKDWTGKDYLVTITTFPAAMVDFTNPAAWEWYKDIIKENMIGIGMGGWMADFGEYLPVDAVLHSGEDPAVLHNQWPALWARLNREAIEECGKLGQVFFFTRAGHTGTVRSSTMMWTGDQHVDWSVDDGLISVVPATLSLAMSGFGITHSDAGGYTTVLHMTRSRELLMRWSEMCAFSPLLRTHEGNQPARDAQFTDDPELLAHAALCSRLHAGLKDYLKAQAALAAERGIPVMRPLFYHYSEEPAYTEQTEYLLGRDILVAPVYREGETARTCWLPHDRWVHLFTGAEYGGGSVTVDAPMGCPPVFVRKDCPDLQALMRLAQQEE